MPKDSLRPPSSLLWRTRHLLGGELQHRLDRGSSHGVHQIVNRHPRFGDQFHHRQDLLPVLREELGQFPLVDFTPVIQGVVISFHGGSPF